jgi:tellurite resistance protein TehA-like permease
MLIRSAPASPLLQSMLPFLKGFAVFYWATATWWIPMLAILAIWRHALKRFPLVYDPLYWGAVFPLAMYTTSTFQLANAIDAPYLIAIPRRFLFVALAAWALTFVGLVARLVSLGRACASAADAAGDPLRVDGGSLARQSSSSG